MVTKEEALKLALDALEYMDGHYLSLPQQGMQALTAVKEALAQPAQEPVATLDVAVNDRTAAINYDHRKHKLISGTKLYTTPPQRKENK